MNPSSKSILYILKILYPKYYFYFPIYLKACLILKSRLLTFKTKPIPKTFIKHGNLVPDLENYCFISRTRFNILNFFNPGSQIYLVTPHRLIIPIPDDNLDHSIIQIPEILFYNLKSPECLQLSFSSKCPQMASNIVVSYVSNQSDVSTKLLETMLQNYFQTPKLLHLNELFEIDLYDVCPHLKFTKLDESRYFFKCSKIFPEGLQECFCVKGETELSMTHNTQSFIPKSVEFVNNGDLVSRCPYGYEKYQDQLEKCINPFLVGSIPGNLQPVFLVKGVTGTRKTLLLDSLSQKLGLHLLKFDCFELSSMTAAHTETKLRTVFLKSKLCSPCIVVLKNFQNLCLDTDGDDDTRLVSFVQSEIHNLLTNNNFPIILICCSTKSLSSNLERLFLEIVNIELPTKSERYDLLRWILKIKKLNLNLEKIAAQTHSFTFADLEYLVNQVVTSETNVSELDFMNVLDDMQNAYSDSIGAPKIPKVYWDDIGGLADIKSEIIKTINYPIKYSNLLKGTRRSGLLLYGPPGTGKTLIAKAVATECGLHFLSIKGPELLNMYVGQSESNVRQVFTRARDAAPCIIFFDELDSLAPNRGLSGDSGGVMDRVVSQLLAEMDGLNQNSSIFIIGATNRPDLIDPALLRPGRFDKLLYVGISSDPASKVAILKALTRKLKFSDGFYQEIGKFLPENVTGADLQAVCSNAWLIAVRRQICEKKSDLKDGVVISIDDFVASIKTLKPSVTKESLSYYKNVLRQYETK